MQPLKFLTIVAITLIFLSASLALGRDWQELKGEHFLVYFTEDEKFARDVLNKAEVYYQRIASDLGYPRYSEFWLWDKRVKIFIYPDHATFLKATGQPSWSQGMADYKNKQIVSFTWSKGFVESLLPHEMAHLIFRDFVGFKGQIPLWLDEGVAQWAEEEKRQHTKNMVKKLYDNDTMLSLKDMMNLDIRNIKEKDRRYIHATLTKKGEKATLILGAENLVDIYYLQSAALVNFLIDKYGANAFASFCRELRDGKTLDEALRSGYPTSIRNLDELESKWREYIAAN